MLRFRLSAKACSLGGSSSSPRNSLRSSFAGAPVYHEQSPLCSVSRKSGNFTRLLAPPLPRTKPFHWVSAGTPLSHASPLALGASGITGMPCPGAPVTPRPFARFRCLRFGNLAFRAVVPLPQPTRFARVVRGPLFQTVGRAIFPVRPDIPAAPRCPPEIRPISASLGRRFGGGYRLASLALQGAGR